MNNFTKLEDFEKSAIKILAPGTQIYYASGAGSENTLRSNIEAFKKIRIIPRVLRDVSKTDLSTTVLGEKISMPLGVSPTARHKLAHPDGEIASVKATESAKTVFILSSYATSTVQQIAKASPNAIKWFQMTIHKDRDCTRHFARRAEQAGFKAIVLTVDYPVVSTLKATENKDASRLITSEVWKDYFQTKLPTESLDNISGRIDNDMIDATVTWQDLLWFKSITKLPIVLKGILSPEDALLAIKYGVNGIIVSNHGGRQLDTVPASIEALPNIVKAVGNKIEVYLDGGIRHGTDVLKALALGARMVFIGRPILWGLACGGEQGARAIFEILQREIQETFALAGCSNAKEVTKDLVAHECYFSRL